MADPAESLAAAVAPLLGEGWSQSGDCPNCIDHADGRRVCIRADSYMRPKRWEISGHVPAHPVHGRRCFQPEEKKAGLAENHEITAAVTKTPGQIARDITRRLLPHYAKSAEANRAWLADQEAKQAAREAVITRLTEMGTSAGARAVDDSRIRGNREARQLTFVTIPSNDSRSPVHGQFQPGYNGDDVNLSLSNVPVPLAERIMSVIAAYPDD